MILEQEEIDSLFSIPKRNKAKTAKITCRVCNVKVEVPITWPGLLCAECGNNPTQTMQHVADVLDGFHTQVSDAWSRLDADIAHSDEVLLGKWNAFQDEVTAGDPLGRVAKAEEVARKNGQGPFATLLRSWLNYKDSLDRLTDREAWATRARAEIDAWGS